jgi:opacity protein-like surface antigen
MKNLFVFSLFLLSCLNFNLNAQIQIGGETPGQKSAPKNDSLKIEKTDNSSSVEVYLGAYWSTCNRKLIINESFNIAPLGERTNETKLNTWSYVLGFKNYFHKNLVADGGIALMQNGESYSFEDPESDSLYNYTTKYNYIAMPLKLNYYRGKDFKFFIGGGIMPQMMRVVRKDVNWTTAMNETQSEIEKTTQGYNSFVLSATVNAGIQMNIMENMALFLNPEYRLQFTSSYLPNKPFKHYNRSFGLCFGLTFKI